MRVYPHFSLWIPITLVHSLNLCKNTSVLGGTVLKQGHFGQSHFYKLTGTIDEHFCPVEPTKKSRWTFCSLGGLIFLCYWSADRWVEPPRSPKRRALHSKRYYRNQGNTVSSSYWPSNTRQGVDHEPGKRERITGNCWKYRLDIQQNPTNDFRGISVRNALIASNILFYYIDKSVLVENRPLVKFIRNYIRDSSGVFSISSLVNILVMSFCAPTLLFVQTYSCLYNNKKKNNHTVAWRHEF